jgi:hypothetical protein
MFYRARVNALAYRFEVTATQVAPLVPKRRFVTHLLTPKARSAQSHPT